MKVVPGDALLHNVHGAAGRTRHPQMAPQTQPAAQNGVQARPAVDTAQAPGGPAAAYQVERPLPQQPARPLPRGSAIDITV